MKKVLFLSHVPPFPEVGGDRLRIAQGLRLLCESHEVDVVYICHNKFHGNMKEYLPSIKNEYRYYAGRLNRYCRALRTVLNTLPEAVNHYRDRRIAEFVKENAHKYDLVFCASPVMAQYAFDISGIRKVLDMTDSLSMNYSNAGKVSSGLKRIWYRQDASRMARFERNCLESFDKVAYISPKDRDYIPGGNKCLVGNAVPEAGPEGLCSYDSGSQRIVFVGKMDYSPNVLAVNFFARQVLPLVRASFPGAQFIVVGSSPTESVRSLSSLDGVEVTGFVKSINPYYREAALVVAPMLSGSGVQNKILQAMAHGCCVLTTPIGFEGIESLGDVVTVVEPDPAEWAEAVKAKMLDRKSVEVSGRKSKERVVEEFGPEGIRKQFEEFIS